MTDDFGRTGRAPDGDNDISALERLFREADYAAGIDGLEERIWRRIQQKLAARIETVSRGDIREISDDEADEVAAAGNIDVMRWKRDV